MTERIDHILEGLGALLQASDRDVAAQDVEAVRAAFDATSGTLTARISTFENRARRGVIGPARSLDLVAELTPVLAFASILRPLKVEKRNICDVLERLIRAYAATSRSAGLVPASAGRAAEKQGGSMRETVEDDVALSASPENVAQRLLEAVEAGDADAFLSARVSLFRELSADQQKRVLTELTRRPAAHFSNKSAREDALEQWRAGVARRRNEAARHREIIGRM